MHAEQATHILVKQRLARQLHRVAPEEVERIPVQMLLEQRLADGSCRLMRRPREAQHLGLGGAKLDLDVVEHLAHTHSLLEDHMQHVAVQLARGRRTHLLRRD